MNVKKEKKLGFNGRWKKPKFSKRVSGESWTKDLVSGLRLGPGIVRRWRTRSVKANTG